MNLCKARRNTDYRLDFSVTCHILANLYSIYMKIKMLTDVMTNKENPKYQLCFINRGQGKWL